MLKGCFLSFILKIAQSYCKAVIVKENPFAETDGLAIVLCNFFNQTYKAAF